MIPDLGKYQEAVLSAYAVSLLLLAVIVALSVWRARSIKRELDTAEAAQAAPAGKAGSQPQ